MTKEVFVETINFMKTRFDNEIVINNYLTAEFGDAIFYPYSNYEVQMVKVLEDIFHDTGEWISYYIYELDFGRKWEPGCVTEDGKDIPLSTPEELYDMLGNDKDRKDFALQFKEEKSNFKIAMVVDMWLTGFDVPCLDTMYLDKPVHSHTLIQTISRVNRCIMYGTGGYAHVLGKMDEE